MAAVGGNDDNQLGENMVGVAYGASLAEVFLYDDSGGNPNSEQEHSQVISFKNDCIDVKVHAYDLEGEGPLPQYRELPSSVRTALSQAIIDGRAGRGQVFVWSAGNGATNGERTDYEELVSSRFTIATGAIDPSYSRVSSSETGSSLFCIAPGSHLIMADRVIDPPPCEPPPYEPSYSSCGPGAAGTSYSAPHVGGVVALMMHANANLAWRDVMDAIARTAATINPASGWQTSQAGIDHSYEYGHGLIDAYEAVSYVDPLINPAWKPLLYEREIIVPLDPDGMTVSPGQTKTLSVDAVANMRVEHVELEMDVTMAGVTGANVGPLEIEIERIWEPEIGEFGFGGGAHKTRSVFTVARTDPTPSYNGAVFTSVRHWGETGTATWKVILRNTSGNMTATWEGAQVRFYGAPKCIADWNMDEIADAADDLAYDEMYNEGDPAADLNGDRMVNGADLDLWEDVYYPAGCQ